MFVVVLEQYAVVKAEGCQKVASWEVGAFADDRKADAIKRAQAYWDSYKNNPLLKCEVPDTNPVEYQYIEEYEVTVYQYFDDGRVHRIWVNGEYTQSGTTKTGAEDVSVPNPSTSSSGPSGWQVLGAIVVAAGVAYGTYRITEAMMPPRRLGVNPTGGESHSWRVTGMAVAKALEAAMESGDLAKMG